MPSSDTSNSRRRDHTLEDLGDTAPAVKTGVDTVNPDAAIGQRPCPIIVPERDVELRIAHGTDTSSTTPIWQSVDPDQIRRPPGLFRN